MAFSGYKKSTDKQQRHKAKPNLGKNPAIDFHMLKIPEFHNHQTDHIKIWVCDGGLVIIKGFYQRKAALGKQSLNCVARNK